VPRLRRGWSKRPAHRHRAYRPLVAPGLVGGRLGERLAAALVRARPVEVRDVLAAHAGQVALAEDEQVIQALAADAPQEALADGVGLRGAVRCAQDLDTARCRNPRECRPELAVVIADEVARALVKRGGLAQLLGDPGAVGWRVAPTWTTRRVPGSTTKNANNGRKRRLVTGRKSQAQVSWAWLRRQVAHVCLRGRGPPGPRKSVWTVRLATAMPSLPSAPRSRSAPQRGLSAAMRRIRATLSAGSGGRPGPGRNCRRQRARNPARCHRRSVSGRTRSRACRQTSTRPASSTRTARSADVTAGRAMPRRRTNSCWCSSAFSARSCARLRSRSPPVPAACVPTSGRAHRQARRACHTPATCRSTAGGTHAHTSPQHSPLLRAVISERHRRTPRE